MYLVTLAYFCCQHLFAVRSEEFDFLLSLQSVSSSAASVAVKVVLFLECEHIRLV